MAHLASYKNPQKGVLKTVLLISIMHILLVIGFGF